MLDIPAGAQFGYWVVIAGPFTIHKRHPGSASYVKLYQCRCQCGLVRNVRRSGLLDGSSQSCGCQHIKRLAAHNTTHGLAHTRLYTTWEGMIQRCHNPQSVNYRRYGGRGIRVCDEWRTNFAPFMRWAAQTGYNDTKQIDRIDNDSGYSPDNCRWVTDAENKRNTSKVHMLTAFGETKCLTDWGLDKRCSVRPATINVRLKYGWKAEKAIAYPRQTRLPSPRFTGNSSCHQRSSIST